MSDEGCCCSMGASFGPLSGFGILVAGCVVEYEQWKWWNKVGEGTLRPFFISFLFDKIEEVQQRRVDVEVEKMGKDGSPRRLQLKTGWNTGGARVGSQTAAGKMTAAEPGQ